MRRILIIRLSAMGDLILSTPLLRELRQRHPRTLISWLVQPQFADLLRGHPGVDEVLLWPRDEWRQLWRGGHLWSLAREVLALRRQLRSREFDLVLDLQGLLKSGLLAWLAGGGQRLGLGSREGSQRLMHRVLERTPPPGLAPDLADVAGAEYQLLARELGRGDGQPPLPMWLCPSDDARRRAAKLARPLLGELDQGRYALLCPFTTRPQKHWTEAGWAGLLPLLAEQLGGADGEIRIAVLGGPADRGKAQALAGDFPLVDLTGHTSIDEALALIERAALVVGVDTGLTHAANALGVPTVALFGSTRTYLDPLNPAGRVVYLHKDCSPCHRHPTCGGSFHCMGDIGPQQVLQAAREAMDAGGRA